jgi:hypothetical protein
MVELMMNVHTCGTVNTTYTMSYGRTLSDLLRNVHTCICKRFVIISNISHTYIGMLHEISYTRTLTVMTNKEPSLTTTEMPSSFLTYQRVCNKSSTNGGTCGLWSRIYYLAGAYVFTPVLWWGSLFFSLFLCVIVWTLHCLSYYFFCICKCFLHSYSFF